MKAKKSTTKSTPTRGGFLKQRLARLLARQQAFLRRRPHRSFRRSKKRDLPKRANLPGYIAFTGKTLQIIRRYGRPFATFLVLYIVASALLVGVVSQENYDTLTESFQSLGQDILGGDVDTATQTLALFGAAVTGTLSGQLTEAQQTYIILLSVVAWLVVVWYLRQRTSGAEVKVRDALYNAGAPLVSTLIIAFVIAIQLLPGAFALLLYTTAEAGGILTGGVEAMMFAVAAALLALLSLYWATSSFIAAVVVTIPGTYPFRALKAAGDIVTGRRTQVMWRILWLALMLLLLWAIILIPMILLAGVITVEWLPLIPVTIAVLNAASILFSVTYVYALYRRMIDEPIA